MTITEPMLQQPSSEPADIKLRELKNTIGQILGRMFYGKMLSEVRNSPLKSKLIHGGRGEEIFQGQLDSMLAERMASSPGNHLGELLYQSYARQQELMANLRVPA